MKWRLEWKNFSSVRKVLSSSRFPVQSRKMSSMYLVKTSGLFFCVWRKSLILTHDINILATVGENTAPIAVP